MALDEIFLRFNPHTLLTNEFSEHKDHYKIVCECRGFHTDNLAIEERNHYIVITGERKSHPKSKEQQYARFSRVFSIPDDADGKRVSATFKNGLLTLIIPKKKNKAHVRKIPIKTGKASTTLEKDKRKKI